MKYSFLIFIITVFTCLILNCSDKKQQNSRINNFEINQNIYFEYIYVNDSWGFNYKHWIIDKNGNVRIHSKKYSSNIDFKELNINYEIYFDSIVYKTSKDEINKYLKLIPSINEYNNRVIYGTSDHLGQTVYRCFKFKNKKLIPLILSSRGDAENIINENVNAKIIDEWLKEINKKIIIPIQLRK